MLFKKVKTPEQLMDYLNNNFEYGVIDNFGNKFYDSNSNEFQEICNTQWKLRSVEKMLQDKIGHCYDQVEIERMWFLKNNYKVKTFWICTYQENVEDSAFCHSYLLFKDGNYWKLFEHSDYFNRGIHKFKTIKQAVAWQKEQHIKFATSIIKPKKKYISCIKEFATPPENINMQEYLSYVETFEDYNM